MKLTFLEEPRVIMSNPASKFNYFAWPTVARLKNGKIAVAASGYRQKHACPFGKAVLSFSEDGGKTYTMPAPIIDTATDNRDGGLTPFGESGLILTSFTVPNDFYRKNGDAFANAYLDTVTEEECARTPWANFRISHDNGVTFGPLMGSPISSPHGPLELSDGTLLWVGKCHDYTGELQGNTTIRAYKILPDGTMEYVGTIPNTETKEDNTFTAEPHCIELPDGTLIAHIRIQKNGVGRYELFTLAQSESYDKGKTWTEPHLIAGELGGAPGHLLRHSSGVLISTCGCRQKPVGIKVLFSLDNGKTWDGHYDLYVNDISGDLGYPSSIELEDGSVLTVFYAHPTDKDEPAVIMQMKWAFDPNQDGENIAPRAIPANKDQGDVLL